MGQPADPQHVPLQPAGGSAGRPGSEREPVETFGGWQVSTGGLARERASTVVGRRKKRQWASRLGVA